VIPKAIAVATFATIIAAALFILQEEGHLALELGTTVYGAFSSCLAFLVVFRNGKAYSRWWDGVLVLTQVKTDWLDACGQLCATTVTDGNHTERAQAYCHVVTPFQYSFMHRFQTHCRHEG